MRITRKEHPYVLALAFAVITTSGCQRSEVAPAATAVPQTQAAVAPTPASSLKLVNAVLATELPESGDINPVTTFASADAFSAVAIIEGQQGQATVRVEILNSDGQVVAQGAREAAVVTKAAIAMPIEVPQGSWSPGAYIARFYLGNVPSWEVAFTITS